MLKVGNVGNYRHGIMAMLHPDLDVRAFCDNNPERLGNGVKVADYLRRQMRPVKDLPPIRGYGSYAEMLEQENLDLVIICTPHGLHAPMALKALAKGCHVYVEKPMCCTLAECEQLVNAVRKTGRKLGICQNVRCTPGFQYLFDQVAVGVIEPYYIHADYISSKSEALENPQDASHHDFSVLMSGGSHSVDLILGLMGAEPREVYALGSKHRTTGAYPFNDMMNVAVKFDGGRAGYSMTTFACVRPGYFAFELYGTKQDVIQTHTHYPPGEQTGNQVGLMFWKDKQVAATMLTYGENPFPARVGKGCMDYGPLENLVYAIKHDVKQRTFADVIDGARNISVCVLAEESARQDKPIKVPHWEPLAYSGSAPLWTLKDYSREIHAEYGRHVTRENIRRVMLGEVS